MPITFLDDDENEVSLPVRFEVCPACEGHGSSSAYLGAFTPEQMREDPEWAEEYVRGDYDRRCEECKGKRVVEAPDEDRCDPKLLETYHRIQQEDADCRRIEHQERMMEGGWREEGWYS